MTTSSLIDHMVSNTSEKIASTGVIHTGISDLSLIFAIRKNTCGIFLHLSNQYVYFYADNPNDVWKIWKQLFLEILNKHAPLQTKRIRSWKTPWVTNDIKNLINTRDSLKRKVVITNVENDWQNYKIARNKVR